MANILFITNSVSHASAINTKNLIVGFGHTVTMKADSTITNISHVTGYDLFVLCRKTLSSTAPNAIIRAAIDAGTPFVMGGVDAGMGNSFAYSTGTAKDLGIANQVEIHDNDGFNVLTSGAATHPLFTGISSLPGRVTTGPLPQAYHAFIQALPHAGTAIGFQNNTTAPTTPLIVVIEVGDLDLFGQPFGARGVYLDFLLNANTFYAGGITVTQNAITWALSYAETPTIKFLSGTSNVATVGMSSSNVNITKTLYGDINYQYPTISTSASVFVGAALTGESLIATTVSSQNAISQIRQLSGSNIVQTPSMTSGGWTGIPVIDITAIPVSVTTSLTEGNVTIVKQLTGVSSNITTNSSLGNVTQVHELGGASSNVYPISPYGFLGEAIQLTGGNLIATTSSIDAGIGKQVTLAGLASYVITGCSVGSLSATINLLGNNLLMNPFSPVGAVENFTAPNPPAKRIIVVSPYPTVNIY